MTVCQQLRVSRGPSHYEVSLADAVIGTLGTFKIDHTRRPYGPSSIEFEFQQTPDGYPLHRKFEIVDAPVFIGRSDDWVWTAPAYEVTAT
jgi:hypothetical protein